MVLKNLFTRNPFLLTSSVFACLMTAVPSTSAAAKSAAAVASKPSMRHLTVAEIEAQGIYPAMEALMYRMCIREVPFFLALHKCYYKDPMLDNGDSLMIKKEVIQALLAGAASRYGEKELTGSPATGIDSMMIFRYKGKGARTTSCNIIIYAPADAYVIPKTGAKVKVPPKTKGTVVYNEGAGSLTVTVFSPGRKSGTSRLCQGVKPGNDHRYGHPLCRACPGGQRVRGPPAVCSKRERRHETGMVA